MEIKVDDINNHEQLLRLEKLLTKLEEYFPEHQVFALDSIDGKLRNSLNSVSKKLGFITLEEMLESYGFCKISGEEVKKIRSKVIYPPGNEPAIIKNKVLSICNRLATYYPNKIIPRGMQNDHKNLSKSISGMYQWLGYETAKDFLTAYGYEYNISDVGGRPKQDYDEIIAYFKAKYSSNPIYFSVKELSDHEPDYVGKIKTLANDSKKLFGMTLKDYLCQQNILKKKETPIKIPKERPLTKAEKNEQLAKEIIKQRCLDKNLDADEELAKLSNLRIEYKEAINAIMVKGIKEFSKIIEIPYGIDKISTLFYKQLDGIEKIIIGETIQTIDLEKFSAFKSLSCMIIKNSRIKIRGKKKCTFDVFIDRTLDIKNFLETKEDASSYEEVIRFLEKCFSIIKIEEVTFWIDDNFNLAFQILEKLYKTKLNLMNQNDLIIKIDEVLENIYHCGWIYGITKFTSSYYATKEIELDDNFEIVRRTK